jgi:glycerophosphoryl diester phosphodiesterase
MSYEAKNNIQNAYSKVENTYLIIAFCKLGLVEVVMKRILIVAHRGASAYEPENTVRSFERAFHLGADFVELDVRLSRDGWLVVIHDEAVDRTTNGSGLVRDLTLKELKVLDADKGEKIPTLTEVLELFRETKQRFIIEVKEPNLEEKLLETIMDHEVQDKVVITSFYHTVLRKIRKKRKDIKCGVIFACQPVNPEKLAIAAEASILLPKLQYVNAEMVSRAHKNNLSIIPWPINDKDEAKKMINLDVDGIVTDKPDILK